MSLQLVGRRLLPGGKKCSWDSGGLNAFKIGRKGLSWALINSVTVSFPPSTFIIYFVRIN